MEIMYYSILLILIYSGFMLIQQWIISKKKTYNIKFRNSRFRQVKKQLINNMNEQDSVFISAGLPFNRYQYNMLRISIICLMITFHLVDTGLSKDNIYSYIIFILFILITTSRLSVFNRRTPFAAVLFILKKNYQRKMDDELYKSLSQLKNLVIVQEDNPMSGDFLFEQLIRFTKKTKKIFIKTLSMIREGNEEGAITFFKLATGTKLGQDFANILSKLDKINPAELKEHLILIQASIRDEKITQKLRIQEMASNLIFLPIIGASIVVLLNFVIIAVWLDSLNNMFNL